MHDLKYADEILRALENGAAGKDRAKAIVVNVKLSPFSHVKAEGLNATFELLVEDEGYRDLRLNIQTSQFTIQCKNCKRSSKHTEPVFECPHCKSYDFDIEKGKEFYIDSIEIK